MDRACYPGDRREALAICDHKNATNCRAWITFVPAPHSKVPSICEGHPMLKRLVTLVACLVVLSCVLGCEGSTDDQPELRLTDPEDRDRL